MGVGLFKNAAGLRRVPFFSFALMVVFPDQGAAVHRVPTRWSSLNGHRLISLTNDYPHQSIIDKQLTKTGVVCTRGQIVKLLVDEGIAVIPSLGMLACRNRKVTMTELTDPVVNLNFYQVTNRGSRMSDEAKEFSGFLKTYITSWAGISRADSPVTVMKAFSLGLSSSMGLRHSFVTSTGDTFLVRTS